MESPRDAANAYADFLREQSWRNLTPMNERRYLLAAVAVNEQVIAIAGHSAIVELSCVESSTIAVGNASDDENESREPRQTEWTALPNLENPRRLFGAAAVSLTSANNDTANQLQTRQCVVIAGGRGEVGNTAAMLDLTNNKWVGLPCMQIKREGCAATVRSVEHVVGIGGVYVVGGYGGGRYFDTVEFMDTAVLASTVVSGGCSSAGWTLLPSIMKVGRAFCAAVMVDCEMGTDGATPKLVVMGGYASGGVTNSVEYYCLDSREWRDLPPMQVKRHYFAAVAVGPCIFAIGGYGGGRNLDSVEFFDFRTQCWTLLPNRLIAGRRSHAAVVVKGHIVVMGGYSGSGLNSVEMLKIGEPASFLHVCLPDLPFIPVGSQGQRLAQTLEGWCTTVEDELSKVKTTVEKILIVAREEYEGTVKKAKARLQSKEEALRERTQGWIESTEEKLSEAKNLLSRGNSPAEFVMLADKGTHEGSRHGGGWLHV